MKTRYSHLTLADRRQIERWRQMRMSATEIARRLGRHRSTIFRELRRNHFHEAEFSPGSSGEMRYPSTKGRSACSAITRFTSSQRR